MKTYSEEKGETPFDWRAFLNQETISYDDARAAVIRAKDWVTCACGNQCNIIPRDGNGQPRDHILNALGGDNGFFAAIEDHNWDEANHILNLIELRSAYLIEKQRIRIKADLMESIARAKESGVEIEFVIK